VSDPDVLDGITAEELRTRHFAPREVRTDREFRCEECRARCTVLTDGTTEVGHCRECSRRLERTGGHRGAPVATDGGEEVSER